MASKQPTLPAILLVVLNAGIWVVASVMQGFSMAGAAVTIANLRTPGDTTEKALLHALLLAPWLPTALFTLAFCLTVFLCYQFVLASRRHTVRHEPETIMPGASTAPYPPPQDINPLDTYFARKRIRLADLVFSDTYSVTDKYFEECYIYGPAMIAPWWDNKVTQCKLGGPLDELLVEIVPGRRVVSLIALRNCTLARCTLVGIGIVRSHTI